MVETLTLLIGLAALIWTGYQEIRMFKMCKQCPFFLSGMDKKNLSPDGRQNSITVAYDNHPTALKAS